MRRGYLITAIGLISVIAAVYHYGRRGPTCPEASRIQAPLNHVAIIMDGNRRWARERGKSAWQGHAAGVQPVKHAIRVCLERDIPFLSLYVFSLENFARPEQELNYLFNVLAEQIAHQELQELYDQGVRVQVLGDRSRFPAHLRDTIARVESTTQSHDRLTLSLLFCYAGQQDIVQAAQSLASRAVSGDITVQDITADSLRASLWTGHLPPPDLIMRTGKAQRLSNFFTFDTAYAELMFLDCYWPDITINMLHDALDDFVKRTRTFGA